MTINPFLARSVTIMTHMSSYLSLLPSCCFYNVVLHFDISVPLLYQLSFTCFLYWLPYSCTCSPSSLASVRHVLRLCRPSGAVDGGTTPGHHTTTHFSLFPLFLRRRPFPASHKILQISHNHLKNKVQQGPHEVSDQDSPLLIDVQR